MAGATDRFDQDHGLYSSAVSIFLIAAAFMPSPRWAVLLFCCGNRWWKWDVPTRQSYVAAVVKPEDGRSRRRNHLVGTAPGAAASAVAGVFMQKWLLRARSCWAAD